MVYSNFHSTLAFCTFIFKVISVRSTHAEVSTTVKSRMVLVCPVRDVESWCKNGAIFWYKDEESISFGTTIFSKFYKTRFEIHKNKNITTGYTYWNLHIIEVLEKDKGRYVCQCGDRVFRTIDLKIGGPNRNPLTILHKNPVINNKDGLNIETSGLKIEASEGDKKELECKATGQHSEKTLITWYRRPFGYTYSEGVNEDIPVTGSQLKLLNITRYSAGVYVCVVSYQNKILWKKEFTLQVNFRPFVSVESPIVHANRSENIFLVCAIQSYPMGKCTWRRNGEKIYPNYKYDFDDDDSLLEQYQTLFVSLLIRTIERRDFTNYSCHTENDKGIHSQTLQLRDASQKDGGS